MIRHNVSIYSAFAKKKMECDLVEKSKIYTWRKMRYFVTAFHFWFALYFASVHAIAGKDNPAHVQDNGFGGRFRFYTSFCLVNIYWFLIKTESLKTKNFNFFYRFVKHYITHCVSCRNYSKRLESIRKIY